MELAASESGLPEAELLKAAWPLPKAATAESGNYQKKQLPKKATIKRAEAATTERGYIQKWQLLRAASVKNGI